MAIRKLDRTFAPSKKEIRYLAKSFPEFRQSLVDFAKVYFPDTYNDFNEASPGMMFIEMASAVGDVLSYYIDSQFKENLISYAQEQDNIISIAQALGYKPKPGTASTTQIDVFQVCPASDISKNYLPDERYLLKLDAGMVLTAPQFNARFRTNQIIDFANPLDREVSVYAVDGLNKPLTYLIKKTVTVISGTITEYRSIFGTPKRFSKLTLPSNQVLEILKVEKILGNDFITDLYYLSNEKTYIPKLRGSTLYEPLGGGRFLGITHTVNYLYKKYQHYFTILNASDPKNIYIEQKISGVTEIFIPKDDKEIDDIFKFFQEKRSVWYQQRVA